MFYGKIFPSAPTTCLLLSFCTVFVGHTASAETLNSCSSNGVPAVSPHLTQVSPNSTADSVPASPRIASVDHQTAFNQVTQLTTPSPNPVLLGNLTGQDIVKTISPTGMQNSATITAGLNFASKDKSSVANLCDSGEYLGGVSKPNQTNSCQKVGASIGIALNLAQTTSQTAKGKLPANSGSGTEVATLTNSTNNLTANPPNPSATGTSNVAKIYAHTVDGKPAATVYVRGIPVMTFVEGESQPRQKDLDLNLNKLDLNKELPQGDKDSKDIKAAIAQDRLQSSTNPIERAAAVASLINQLNREGEDASKITPEWQSGSFVIKFGTRGILRFDQSVRLPETTKEPSLDVLESANLIRRLMGGASPLNAVLNAPPTTNAALGQVLQVASGIASWYGPGFAGNLSASGEIFDPEAMTAAHPSLPFGTMVRVINMDNNQSVVVRINDRGPYVPGRVLDMSAAAARSIGLMNTGIAPVKLEVLGATVK